MKIARLHGKPEIFYSIQGEGVHMGQPSVFIRCSLCNLHCVWCDTDYTWNWEKTPFKHVRDRDKNYIKYKPEEQIVILTPEEIVEQVQTYPCEHVIFTGGEPLLQQDECLKVMHMLRQKSEHYWFEVETNGTIMPKAKMDQLVSFYNVSPKLENSHNALNLRQVPEVYRFFADHKRSVFKFVITKENDLVSVQELITTFSISASKIILMPEGVTPEQLREKSQWLIEICKKYGYRFTDRLHVHIYGNRRGV